MRSKLILSFVLLVSIALCVLSVPASLFKKQDERTSLKKEQERHVYQFAMMIDCATNRSGWEYSDYGCYCGYGGSGTPVDETDRCCYTHDYCYDYLVTNNICSVWWMPYFATYLYTGCNKCEPESSYPPDDVNAACRAALCECDSKAAECFAKASFDAANIGYDTSKC